MRIIRVFPRRTKATPVDDLVRTGPPGLFDEADEVHISVAFTYDLPRAEWLAKQWGDVATVKIGGPATGERGEEFVPGRYIRDGYVITSRGCPNRCWFCDAWKREGEIRELPIRDGWNVLDSNLLACSDDHIRAVFTMLKRQKQPVEFTGGLEAARLKPWHVELLRNLKPKQMFFAYDTPDDYEPLWEAGKVLLGAGFTTTSHALRAYVLCGYPRDTFEAAEKRIIETVMAGFMPMAMVWTPKNGKADPEWKRWQRQWARPAIMASHAEAVKGRISALKAII
ncbi:MAG: hypothetical protein WC455_26820 [Dehalococcoidia bacterium]|jgi:hypothetical protein